MTPLRLKADERGLGYQMVLSTVDKTPLEPCPPTMKIRPDSRALPAKTLAVDKPMPELKF